MLKRTTKLPNAACRIKEKKNICLRADYTRVYYSIVKVPYKKDGSLNKS